MNEFQQKLKNKMDTLAHLIYEITQEFPKEEQYGTVSQLRRASLSIVLNYVEGYARRKPLVRLNFLEISYGSAAEVEYLLEFSKTEGFIGPKTYQKCTMLQKEVSAMLWTEMNNLRQSVK